MVCAIALVAGSASAACGGGGYHPTSTSSTNAPTAVNVPAVVRTSNAPAPTPDAQNVSYVRSESFASLDSSRFDALSASLQLTGRQLKDISNAKEDIRDESEKLVKAQRKAQSRLDRCSGDCSDEQRRLASANEALQRFDPTREFENRLSSILKPSQADMYRASNQKKASAGEVVELKKNS